MQRELAPKDTTPFYIAEVSANHNGSLSRAKSLIEAAAEAGASAVKLQTYRADTMTLNHPNFKVSDNHKLWGGYPLFKLYEEASTPWEWHRELFEYAQSLNLIAFSTPFDISAVDFLEELNCPMYKIASLETGDVDLISYVASKDKPLIVSTGASTMDEIEKAVQAANTIHHKLTLLVCTSSYPTDAKDSHVRRILTLKEKFGVDVGLSDHTLGIGVSLAAISLGATVIEKHLTLKRSDGGHDAAFSLEPEEFKVLVEEGNRAQSALGSPEWLILDSEAESRRLRRSLYIVKHVVRGEIATRENVRSLRPNTGGSISDLHKILGKRFKASFRPGDPASPDCVE